MRTIKLETDNYYHIYNRGANKQDVFLDDKDYFRFLRNIWEVNNKSTSDWRDYCLRNIKTGRKGKLSFGYPKLSLPIFILETWLGYAPIKIVER